jgi:hypothetical protein
LQFRCILKRSSSRESLSCRIIKLIDYGARARRNRARGWGIGSLFVCAYQRPFVTASEYQPSMTLPSRQFPGLFCFGAGVFSLIFPAGLSFATFLGATLMVESSSLATEAGGVSCATEGWREWIYTFATAHSCSHNGGDGCDAVVDGLSRHSSRDVVEIEATRLPLWSRPLPVSAWCGGAGPGARKGVILGYGS